MTFKNLENLRLYPPARGMTREKRAINREIQVKQASSPGFMCASSYCFHSNPQSPYRPQATSRSDATQPSTIQPGYSAGSALTAFRLSSSAADNFSADAAMLSSS